MEIEAPSTTQKIDIGLNGNSNFVTLWLSTMVSNLGDGIGLTAAPLLAASLTRDPALVAGLVTAQRLPWFLFVLVSGVLVDRLDRRWVLVSANLFRATVIGILGIAILTGSQSLLLLYMVFFLLGTAETLFDNASLAILPAIVPETHLEKANGRLFATQIVTNEFIGPPLGGLLFATLAAIPFLLNASSFAITALLLMVLVGNFKIDSDQPRQNLWRSISEGMRWFWSSLLIRTFGVMAGVFNFLFAATSGIFVLYAQNILGLGDVEYGLLLASGAIGGVVGALTADSLVRQLGIVRTILADVALNCLAFFVMAITSHAGMVSVAFIATSFANTVGNVVLISLRQSIIPPHLLGRVTSVYRLFALGALPMGAMVGGFLAKGYGLRAPYWMGGMTLLVMGFVLTQILTQEAIAKAKMAHL